MSLFRSKTKTLSSLAKHIPLVELRRRVKIVVIDDDENAFPLSALRDAGYSIEHWDKVKSVERLEQGDFDIIILDIGGVADHLTPAEGLGILQHLKEFNPAQIVIAFSGQSFDLSKQRFFKLADDVLPKPTDHLKCKQVLDSLIESKFTVPHLWSSVQAVLIKEGVPEKSVRKIEASLSRAIANGGPPDYTEIVNEATEKAELALKVTGLLIKIAGLCGLGGNA